MSQECVVAVFESLEQAQEAVHILDRGEFPTEQVSLVTKGVGEHSEIKEDLADDSARDAAAGAGLGAVVGALTGVAVMAVSGLGAVFLAGPIGGGMVGAVTGAFLGSMGGWGVHENRIKHYEKLVGEGKILVVAHGNPLELVHAQRMLEETDPEELHVHARTSSEFPEVEQ